MRVAKVLLPWIGGAILGSAVTCGAGIALHIHNSEKWFESERILTEAISTSTQRPNITIECHDCDWPTFQASLPRLSFTRCVDNVPLSWGWALECVAYFQDESCLPADVYEREGEWRVSVAGRLASHLKCNTR